MRRIKVRNRQWINYLYIELEIEASADSVALEKAKEIAEFVLYNPLVEDFELEVLNTPIEN